MHQLLQLAINACEAACKEILDVYNSGNFQTEAKDDNSPLTLADKKAHNVIVSMLRSSNLPILSEEGKHIAYEERSRWQRFWLVDPLDGTKEFLKRNGEFTVNIALIENQKPVLGVVAIPVNGDVFYAQQGSGAFVKRNGSIILLPRRSPIDLNRVGVKVVASRSHMSDETQAFIQSLADPILVSQGSSLKFMLLAEGNADVYPRFAPTMEWDTAAAHAIVNETGISVLQKDTNDSLIYNKPDLLNPYFICM
ncbi:MAG: 3'(2'),5'-bisphosphate nucleotidase CysQ [Bacteroidia bacterium]|nr:3'(2'),5'-bisphosphate nucleotidase CysQ [Bacteroidia bacterium]